MRSRKLSLNPPELAALQAAGHTKQTKRDWWTLFGSTSNYPGSAIRSALELWLAGHPTTGATREMAAIHEAGHFILFERMGMHAGTARIYGPKGGRGAWVGTAGAWGHPDHDQIINAKTWGHAPLWGEAVAAMAGPIAEELVGEGDALSSIGELLGASLWAVRVAGLTKRDPEAAVLDAVGEAISLVEFHATEITDTAELLARRKRISRDRSVETILARVPRGPVRVAPLSARGGALCTKIMAAFEQVWFSVPGLSQQSWDLLE